MLQAPEPPLRASPTASVGFGSSPRGRTLLPESTGTTQTPPCAQIQPNQAGSLALACPTHLGPSLDGLVEPGASGSRGSSTAMSRAPLPKPEMTHNGQEKPPRRKPGVHRGAPNLSASRRNTTTTTPPARRRRFLCHATCPRARDEKEKSVGEQQKGPRLFRGEHNKSPTAPPPHSCPDVTPR